MKATIDAGEKTVSVTTSAPDSVVRLVRSARSALFGANGTHPRRGVWAQHDRLHIDVRAVVPERFVDFATEMKRALDELEHVRWTHVVPALGRIIVAVDDPNGSTDQILDVIEDVEERYGAPVPIDDDHRPEYPGDIEPIARTATALAGDVFGLGLSAFSAITSVARIPVVSIDASSLITLIENVPALRKMVESRIGRRAADISLALSNAIAHGLAHSPFGPALDSAYRTMILFELAARRTAWAQREPELFAHPRQATLEDQIAVDRPMPLRPGPIEEYAQRAWVASLGGSVAAAAVTRNLGRTSAVLSAGIPKAARLGREAFAATLSRALSARKVIVISPLALRSFDRIDTVFVEAELLAGGGAMIGEVLAVDNVPLTRLKRRMATLFDPAQPATVRRLNSYVIGPVAELGVPLDEHAAGAFERLSRTGRLVLGLVRDDRLVALAETKPALAPHAEQLLNAVRGAELKLVLVSDTHDASQTFDARVVSSADFAEAVLDEQSTGRGVAAIASRPSIGFASADVRIGMVTDTSAPPWGASILCGSDLTDARLLIDAMTEARQASRQSVMIAVAGASVGGFFAFASPLPRTTPRVMLALNAATAVAMVNGIRIGTSLAYRPTPVSRDPTPWHMLAIDEVLLRVGSRSEGLTAGEADGRLPREAVRTRSAVVELTRAIADELINPLTPVLATGAGLSAAVGSIVDAAMVSGVVLLNAGIGGIQRFRTTRALRELSRTGSRPVTVLRDGEEHRIPTEELVVGDVLRLRSGDAVSADCRIIDDNGLEVDESSLTGESLPVVKRSDPTVASAVADRTSMLYDGTSIAAGEGTAVVVAVGPQTETRAALEWSDDEVPATGVEMRLRSLANLTAPVSAAAGAGIVGAGLLRGIPFTDLAAAGVSLAVAAAPEGLPLLATVAQLGAARRLGTRGVLVRNHRAIEALGRVNVVCFDKTGTLTEGRISLAVVSDGRREERAEDLSELRDVVLCGLRASPDPNERLAHATDKAMVRGALDLGFKEHNGEWERLDELPFEPSRGYHAVLGRTKRGLVIAVKGAPEVVFPRCRAWRRTDGEHVLDAEAVAALESEVEHLALRGFRVLAVAERDASSTGDLDGDRISNLVLVGFVGLADPVRTSAALAVDGLARAGVATVMITGDHPSTAEGIASELGLLNDMGILTGPQIDAMDDEEIDRAIEGTTVFARVTPSHKVRIVRAYQRIGRIVAMTGDGANDAPAIRLADVGIALGERSTAAAREAADLIVLDERIETIVDAVVEGRALWTSVRESVAMLVGGNFGEIGFTAAGSILFGRPPLNARQLLLVNLMTDVAPAMAIALRPPRRRTPEELIQEGPDASLGGRLTRAIAARAVTTAAGAGMAWVGARATGTRARASTVGLVALVGTQLGQTIVAGGHDPVVAAAALGSAALLGVVVQTPGLSHFFGCRPLGPVGWGIATASSTVATGASVIVPKALKPLQRSSR